MKHMQVQPAAGWGITTFLCLDLVKAEKGSRVLDQTLVRLEGRQPHTFTS